MKCAKKTKLKKLEVNSVDLVPAGANQDAHINLYKSKEQPVWERFVEKVKKTFGMDEAELQAVYEERFQTVNKQRIENEIWDYTSALRESFSSIVNDGELGSKARAELLAKSMDEFTTAMSEVIPLWSSGQESLQKSLDDETVQLYKQLEIEALEQRVALLKDSEYKPNEALDNEDLDDEFEDDELSDDEFEDDEFEDDELSDDEFEDDTDHDEQEESDMKIDKSLLSTEEQATLDALIQKSMVTEDTVEKSFDNPEMEEMQAKVYELEKALAMKEYEVLAKGYEILGKKPEELAKSMYAMSEAGAETFAEFMEALDIAKAAKENSGMFEEVGKSRTVGGYGVQNQIEAKAADIMKADPSLSKVQAIAKAWEQNPDLIKEYDKGE